MRPTQGRTLAVVQVSGGSQSFNAVNSLRVLGRWMRMITIPNQSSVPIAYMEFDDDGQMKPGPLYDRVEDVSAELMKFTMVTRARTDCQTALNIDPGSASNFDPLMGYGGTPLISPAKRVGVAQPG